MKKTLNLLYLVKQIPVKNITTEKQKQVIGHMASASRGDALVVGVLHGFDLCFISRIFRALHRPYKVYGIDRFEPGKNPRFVGLSHKNTLANVNKFAAPNRVEITPGDSTVIGPEWDKPLGLLFIDGGHTYDVVSQDWVNFSKHIMIGGYVVFHDYNPKSWPDVFRLCNEIRDTDRRFALECVKERLAIFKRIHAE